MQERDLGQRACPVAKGKGMEARPTWDPALWLRSSDSEQASEGLGRGGRELSLPEPDATRPHALHSLTDAPRRPPQQEQVKGAQRWGCVLVLSNAGAFSVLGPPYQDGAAVLSAHEGWFQEPLWTPKSMHAQSLRERVLHRTHAHLALQAGSCLEYLSYPRQYKHHAELLNCTV